MKLNDLTSEATREASGNFASTKAGLAIGTVKSGINTANTIQFCINGISYTKAAVTSEVLVAAPGTPAFVPIPTGKTCYIVMCLNSSGTVYAVQGEYDGQTFVNANSMPTVASNAARVGKSVIPDIPSTLTAFGYIKVVNASGSNFVIGTTLFDAASVTTTFTDVMQLPATNP